MIQPRVRRQDLMDSDTEWLVQAVRRRELIEAGINPETPEAQAWIHQPGTTQTYIISADPVHLVPTPKQKSRPRPINPDGPCSVYRAYNAEGVLLYVGITARGVWRARQHGYRSEWWREMTRMEWEHFDNRNDALDRETELIAAQDPVHNKVRPTPDKPRSRRMV
jgi:hypothetical protein